jgi:hypothetical protein
LVGLFEGFWWFPGFLWVVLRVFGWVCRGFPLGLLWPPLYTPCVIRVPFTFSLIKLLITYKKKKCTKVGNIEGIYNIHGQD